MNKTSSVFFRHILLARRKMRRLHSTTVENVQMAYGKSYRASSIAYQKTADSSSWSNEQQLHDDEHRQEDDEREAQHIAKERRHLHTTLLSDALHHEVRAIADVGH